MTYPIGEAPAPNLRQPLRVELFFLTHAETGEPLTHPNAHAVALAGAALIDDLLRPVERLRIVGPQVVVVNADVSGDPVADWVVRTLGGHRGASVLDRPQRSYSVRDAVRAIAVHAYDRTAAGMYAGDLVQELKRRRLSGGRRRYPPTDTGVIARVRGRLCSVLTGHTPPDPQTAALAGLVLALDLTSELYLDGSGLDVRSLLKALVDWAGRGMPEIQQLIGATDDLIAEAAVAVYGQSR
jgi:hypothetical protein